LILATRLDYWQLQEQPADIVEALIVLLNERAEAYKTPGEDD
jgi:hypothetical protein